MFARPGGRAVTSFTMRSVWELYLQFYQNSNSGNRQQTEQNIEMIAKNMKKKVERTQQIQKEARKKIQADWKLWFSKTC